MPQSDSAGRLPAIRPLGWDDVPAAAEFLNECWRATYHGVLDAGFLDRMTVQTRIAILRDKLAGGMRGILVDDVDAPEDIAGFALFGPTHLELLGNAGEVNMLYVRPELIGTGLGHRLIVEAEAALVADGFEEIGLDVFTANRRAIRFYQIHGYQKVGAKVDHIEGEDYELDIMVKVVSR